MGDLVNLRIERKRLTRRRAGRTAPCPQPRRHARSSSATTEPTRTWPYRIETDLVAAIDSERQLGNLSSAIRLFVLDHYKARIGVHADGRPAPREMMMMPPSVASVMRAE